jgi:hypothetical protein
MDRDAAALRAGAPVLFTSVAHGDGMEEVVEWVRAAVRRRSWAPAGSTLRGDGHHHHDHEHA